MRFVFPSINHKIRFWVAQRFSAAVAYVLAALAAEAGCQNNGRPLESN
jgi:hypothetical protein